LRRIEKDWEGLRRIEKDWEGLRWCRVFTYCIRFNFFLFSDMQLLLNRMVSPVMGSPVNGALPLNGANSNGSHEPRALLSASSNTALTMLDGATATTATCQFMSASSPTPNLEIEIDNDSDNAMKVETDGAPVKLEDDEGNNNNSSNSGHNVKSKTARSSVSVHTCSSSEEGGADHEAPSHEELGVGASATHVHDGTFGGVDFNNSNNGNYHNQSTSDVSSVVDSSMPATQNRYANAGVEMAGANGGGYGINGAMTRIYHSDEVGRAFPPPTSAIGSPYLGQHFPFSSFLAMNQHAAHLRPVSAVASHSHGGPNGGIASLATGPLVNGNQFSNSNNSFGRGTSHPLNATIGDIIKSELAKMHNGMNGVASLVESVQHACTNEGATEKNGNGNARENANSTNNNNGNINNANASNHNFNNTNNNNASHANGMQHQHVLSSASPAQQQTMGSRMTLLSSISLAGV
jgi:hypothetical protein